MKAVLKQPSLIILGLAESVSNIGSWITMMAILSIIVFRGHGSVAHSSGIILAALVPMLVFSPLAGSLCDRLDRKHLMIASQLLSGLTVTCLMFVEQIAWIYALIAVQSIFSTVMTPARQSAVRDLVQTEDLTHANAFLQQLSATIKIGAPMLGGAVLSLFNPHQAMLLDVISYGIAALVLMRLPALPPKAASPGNASTGQRPSESLFAVVGKVFQDFPLLRLVFPLTFVMTLILMVFDATAAVMTRDVLQADEGIFGILVGIVGLGTVASATGLMVRKREGNPWQDVIKGQLLLTSIPATVVVASWLTVPWLTRSVVALGCLLGGLGSGLLNVQINTLIQRLAPAGWLGRIGGAFQGTIVAGQLIAVISTPLLIPTHVSLTSYFAVSTVLLLVLIAVTMIVLNRNGQGTGAGLNRVQEVKIGE